MLPFLLLALLFLSGLEPSKSEDYPTIETYSDALGELTDVVQSLLPLKDLLQNKAENQKLTEEQVSMINHLIRNNSALQERVRLLDREVIQCNASLQILEESRSLHSVQLQRLNNERKLAVDNCQLRLQLAQTQASNAIESLRLLKQSQNSQINQRRRDDEIEATDPMNDCIDDSEFNRLKQITDVIKSEKQIADQEIQRLKSEKQKLEESAVTSEKLITRLSKMEQVATGEVLKLRKNIFEVKEFYLNINKNLIEKHANQTIELHKENFQLKLNNSILIQIMNSRIVKQSAEDGSIKTCNDRIEKLSKENSILRDDKVKLIHDTQILNRNIIKLSKEKDDLKSAALTLGDTLSTMQRQFDSMRSNNTDLESRNQELETKNSELQTRYDELAKKMTTMTENNDEIQRSMQEKSKAELELRILEQEFLKYKKSCYKIVYWG